MSGKRDREIREEAKKAFLELSRDSRDRFADDFKAFLRWFKKNRRVLKKGKQ